MVHHNEEFVLCLEEIFFVGRPGLGDNVGLRNAAHGLLGWGNRCETTLVDCPTVFDTQGDYGSSHLTPLAIYVALVFGGLASLSDKYHFSDRRQHYVFGG